MFRKICVALDNSPLSDTCCAAAVSLARAFNSKIVGCHVYAARMHEGRFRQMEATLPQEYLGDQDLERQRAIHDSLIGLGLRLISESYLNDLERRSLEAEVSFARKTCDGKNWERLAEEINSSEYDLVVMGGRGHGSTRVDSVGSVCLRVLRNTKTDTLVVKDPAAFENGAGRGILVALDGSPESFGALRSALALGKTYGRPVEAIGVYDPYFHYAVFHSMVEVLSSEAARVFRFKEQERLHEEIIDSGLARLYGGHLDVAQRIAENEGITLEKTLLAGRAADEVAAYAEATRPWLLLLGRIGAHSRQEMDIGSVTEQVLRSCSCNLLVSSRRFSPPLEVWSELSVQWTREAETVLNRVPDGHRGALRMLVHRLALEQGHTVITKSLVAEAVKALAPRQEQMQRMGEVAFSAAVEELCKEPGTIYLCPRCGHGARETRPVACPACRHDGKGLLPVDTESLEASARAQGGVEGGSAFDGASTRWAHAALETLQRFQEPWERGKARLRVEKAARLAKMPVITLEFALQHLPVAYESAGHSQGTPH